MPSCRSSSKTSTQAHHSLSLSQRSYLQQWMTCLDGRTNILCLKTTSEQRLNRSWSPMARLRTMRPGVLSPRTNQGKLARGELVSNNNKWDSPLGISYEKLLPIIHDMSDFRWLEPIKTNTTGQDRNIRCSYHKDHDHTTEQCKSLHYLVEKLIKFGHLKQYVHTTSMQRKTTQKATVQAPVFSTTPRVVINYIHGGPVDDRHNSKW